MNKLKSNFPVTTVYIELASCFTLTAIMFVALFTLPDLSKTLQILNGIFNENNEAKIAIISTGLFVTLILDASVNIRRLFNSPSKRLMEIVDEQKEETTEINNLKPTTKEDSHGK